MTIRVLVVDDHPVFREGLEQCLGARRGVRVAGAVGSAAELRSWLDEGGVTDVVLMDVELPGEDGIALTRELRDRRPDLPVVMLTAFADGERLLQSIKAGAVGFLRKNAEPDEIVATVERAARGEPLLSGEMAGQVLREFEREREASRRRKDLDALTAREEECLRLLATGESNKAIARRLGISEPTVKNHVASIFRKLHVNDRTKAALLAVKLGLGGDDAPDGS